MSVPKVLTDKREKLLKQAQAEGKTPEEVIVAESAIVEDPPVIEPVTEPIVPTAEVVQEAPLVIEKPVETFEAQYRTAQGIADKAGRDLSAAQQENTKNKETIEKLLDSLDILLAKQKEVPVPEVKPEPVAVIPQVESLTDDEVEVLAELRPLMERVGDIRADMRIELAIPRILEIVRSEISTFKGQVDTVVKTTEEDRKRNKFNEELYGQVSNADAITHEPAFVEWIKGKEDIEGNAYTEIYSKAAFTDFKAKPVINILKEYMATKPVTAIPVIQPKPTMEVTSHSIPPELEEQIAPARAVGSEIPGGKPGIEIVTLNDVAEIGNRAIRSPNDVALRAKYEDIRMRYYLYTEAQKQVAKGKK